MLALSANQVPRGFEGLTRHRLDAAGKGSMAAGREAWRFTDAGTDEAKERYEHTYWQHNIGYSKKKDCPASWLQMEHAFWVNIVGATEYDIVLERSLDEPINRKGFKKAKKGSQSLHAHAIIKISAPTGSGTACRWLLKRLLCAHLGVDPSEVVQFLKPFSDMKEKTAELMCAYHGKASHLPGFERLTSFTNVQLEAGRAKLNALNAKPWVDKITVNMTSRLQMVANFKQDQLAPLGGVIPEPIVLTLMINSLLFTFDRCFGMSAAATRPNIQATELLHKCWDHPLDWTVQDTLRLVYTWSESSRYCDYVVDQDVLQQGPLLTPTGTLVHKFTEDEQASLPDFCDNSVDVPKDYGVHNRINGMCRLPFSSSECAEHDGFILENIRPVGRNVVPMPHEVVIEPEAFGNRGSDWGDTIRLDKDDVMERYYCTNKLRNGGPIWTSASRWFPQLDVTIELRHHLVHPLHYYAPYVSRIAIVLLVLPYATI